MSVLQQKDDLPRQETPAFKPVDLPRARTFSGAVARVWAYSQGRISNDEHMAACEIIFKHFDGCACHPRVLEERVDHAYRGLTGLKPNIGVLQCDQLDVAVLGIGVAFLGGKGFLSCRAITLRHSTSKQSKRKGDR